MWDQPSEGEDKVLMYIVSIVFLGIFIYLHSIFLDYKFNTINEEQSATITTVIPLERYEIPVNLKYKSNQDKLKKVFNTQEDYLVYQELEEEMSMFSHKMSYFLFKLEDRYLLTRLKYQSDLRKQKELYLVESTFLNDSAYVCSTKLLDKETCSEVQQSKLLSY